MTNRTDFEKNNLGSAKHGAGHWIGQRITALALIPMILVLVLAFSLIADNPLRNMPIFFSYWFNMVIFVLFIAVGLYHGALGMRVIIEDYISCTWRRYFYIILVNFIAVLSGAAAIIAAFKLHIFSVILV